MTERHGIRAGAAHRAAMRWIAASQRFTSRLHQVLGELALALHEPGLERVSTDRHYAGGSRYLTNQREGLYPFERRALDRYFPKPPARVLVPGMGGGREVIALLREGYRVHGFEPVERLVEAARSATAEESRARLWKASLQDWAGEPSGSYDAILVGWGLWAHMIAQQDRLAALRAFRRVCPSGPVLLSFHRGEDVYDHEEREAALEPLHPEASGRLERVIRGGLRERVLRRPPIERGTVFSRDIFVHLTTEAELAEEGAASGWRVAHYERDGSRYPNAVLVTG